jgi:hypothetical protein
MVTSNALSYLAFAVLLLLSFLMGQQVIEVGLQAPAENQLEHYTKILLGILSGLGAVFVLFLKHQIEERQRGQDAAARQGALQEQFAHEQSLVLLRGAIEQLTTTAARSEEARMGALSEFAKAYIAEKFEPKLKQLEVAAENLSKYKALKYEEDFKRRERRYGALVELSRSLYRTTRAFNALCSFRLAPGESSDSLVSVLTTALTNRETFFLAAREDLLILHMIDPDHADDLLDYSRHLTEIIIDVRRLDASALSDQTDYEQKMKGHAAALESANKVLGKLLSVFLAPQEEEPDPPGGRASRLAAA